MDFETTKADLETLAYLLDSLAPAAADPADLLQSLGSFIYDMRQSFDSHESLSAIERGLAYTFSSDERHPGSLKLGNEFSSLNKNWPPPFSLVPNHEKDLWLALAEVAKTPLIQAHFLDLAISSGKPTNRDTAEKLVRLYLQIGTGAIGDTFYQSACLHRASSLSRQFQLPLEMNARQALFSFATEDRPDKPLSPGALMHCLRPLSVPPRYGEFANPSKNQIIELLKDSRPRRADTFLLEELTEMLAQLLEEEEDIRIARQFFVQVMLDTAHETIGIGRISWLNQAAETAKRFQLHKMHDEAVQALQSLQPEEVELQKLEVEMPVPVYAFDQHLRTFRKATDIHTALRMWLTTGSPTGHHEKNLEQAATLSEKSIVSYITRIELDSKLLPRTTSSDFDSARDYWLNTVEQLEFQSRGQMLAGELFLIRDSFKMPTSEHIATRLANDYKCSSELAQGFSEALSSFWDDRYSDAGRAAYPLIEAGARGLLMSLGCPLYRIQTGKSAGRFPALEKYIDELEARDFDPDWVRCLRNPVSYLRNSLAHGHLLSLSKVDAAILLRTAGLLTVLAPEHSIPVDQNSVHSRLRDPVSWIGTIGRLVPHARIVWEPSSG